MNWCKHIKLKKVYTLSRRIGYMFHFTTHKQEIVVTKNWKLCPVCLKKRKDIDELETTSQ